MPRQARLDAEGTLHHVIIRGIEKGRIFDDEEDRQNFIQRLGPLAIESKTKIYAWSLMPSHVHLLLRSGPLGLPRFMRRVLTGYAITYNRRHRRHGHLFQNRYKSIVCEEDPYFQELVRYIHLNPLRAGLVRNLHQLDRYAWSGHSMLMGKISRPWQDGDYVLSWFGKREGAARKAYRGYVEEGIFQGQRPELVGGGLIRSLGDWSAVLSMRRAGDRVWTDERILGVGDFVEKVLQEADEKARDQFRGIDRREKMQRLIESTCQREDISIDELRMGSRRGRLPQIRSVLASRLVTELGISLAEAARQLGVSTSSNSKTLVRRKKKIMST
jgi:putative transposase